MNRLQQKYYEDVAPKLEKEFSITNVFALVRPMKVVVNIGINRKVETDAAKTIESLTEQLKVITGQKPKMTTAKKSIAGFKIRAGDTVGLAVTLRGNLMWQFLDKVISITLPRTKDFQGVPRKGLDTAGNYNLGFPEQIVFPEIEYDKINKVMGLQMTIVMNRKDRKQSERMLELLGIPFEKVESN